MSETIAGTVERVTFHNPENGFSVLQVSMRGAGARVTIVGNLPAVSPGEKVEATGEWRQDRVHGRQFQAETLAISLPTGKEGIERYLGSGMIRGVGEHLAKMIVREFGSRTLEVIEKTPRQLERVSGIGPKRAAQIASSWQSQKSVRDLMLFLHSHGIGSGTAWRIHRHWGANAIGMIRENPYRLADEVRGIGFRSADSIALGLGFEKSSPFRARAGVSWALSEASGAAGHCGLPEGELIETATRLLEIGPEIVREAIDAEIAAGSLVRDTVREVPVVFSRRLHRAEQEIAEAILRLQKGVTPWPAIDVSKAIGWVEKRLGIELAGGQRQALQTVLGSRVTVVTGGPGVGKTTLINSIISILAVKGVEIELAAPTGRAAKRLFESTGRSARTIHRLLEVNAKTLQFTRNEDNPLDCDLLVVDETSMIDVPLMQSLVRAIPARAALILVGDAEQLPSVGPGQVLTDLITSGAVPVARLTEIFRQAARSRIVVNAHRINQGLMPELESPEELSDFYFVRADEPEVAVQRVLQVVSDRIPRRFGLDPRRDIQVLAPMNRGIAGVRGLNQELQKLLNPDGLTSGRCIERFGTIYAPGDKVMQIENDYDREVFNGDIGLIRSLDTEEEIVTVEFEGRPVEYGLDDLDQLVLAYATTIHKSQGSEYPAVVIPLLNQHHIMLQRNLLYTAMTRGKKLVVLVGQKQAIGIAVRNARGRVRWSRLREWLVEGARGAL